MGRSEVTVVQMGGSSEVHTEATFLSQGSFTFNYKLKIMLTKTCLHSLRKYSGY